MAWVNRRLGHAPFRFAAKLVSVMLVATASSSCAASNDHLLHLPGIAGPKSIDRAVNHGLVEGGFDGTMEIYDWTEHDPGMDALVAWPRNQKEAKLISEMIVKERAAKAAGGGREKYY